MSPDELFSKAYGFVADIKPTDSEEMQGVKATIQALIGHASKLQIFYEHCQDSHSLPDCCCPDVGEGAPYEGTRQQWQDRAIRAETKLMEYERAKGGA